jgi:hypothetical protein
MRRVRGRDLVAIADDEATLGAIGADLGLPSVKCRPPMANGEQPQLAKVMVARKRLRSKTKTTITTMAASPGRTIRPHDQAARSGRAIRPHDMPAASHAPAVALCRSEPPWSRLGRPVQSQTDLIVFQFKICSGFFL